MSFTNGAYKSILTLATDAIQIILRERERGRERERERKCKREREREKERRKRGWRWRERNGEREKRKAAFSSILQAVLLEGAFHLDESTGSRGA